MSSVTAPETIEGTWEELSRQADKMIMKGMFPALLDVTEEDSRRRIISVAALVSSSR